MMTPYLQLDVGCSSSSNDEDNFVADNDSLCGFMKRMEGPSQRHDVMVNLKDFFVTWRGRERPLRGALPPLWRTISV